MRNLAAATATAESVAQSGLNRKRAEVRASQIWNGLKAELAPEELERLRVALIPHVLGKPKPKGVKWAPKAPVKVVDEHQAEIERVFGRLSGEGAA